MQTARVHDLRPGKPPEGQLDGGEGNEDGQGFGKVLEVLGETPVDTDLIFPFGKSPTRTP
jgi:hypothetical protein